jgi:hypothetical protein
MSDTPGNALSNDPYLITIIHCMVQLYLLHWAKIYTTSFRVKYSQVLILRILDFSPFCGYCPKLIRLSIFHLMLHV